MVNEPQAIRPETSARVANKAVILLWILIVSFSALRFVHLMADFPNRTLWAADQAKFTDEGWWAGSAVTHQLDGCWTVPGDYNPGVAVPVWTVVLALVFRVTGVSLVAARAVSVVFSLGAVLLLYLLVRRSISWGQLGTSLQMAPLAAVLLSASPFAFVFSRLAILDSAVVFEFCLLLLVASGFATGRGWTRVLVLGVLVALMVLTKTTAITLIPAVAWLALWAMGMSVRNGITVALGVGVVPAILLAGWYGIVRVTGYLADLQYFFDVNAMETFDIRALPQTLLHVVEKGRWADPILFPLAIGFILLACFRLRSLWRNPLFVSAVIAMNCQMVYLVRRQNDIAPRYFLPLLVPVILIVVLGFEATSRSASRTKSGGLGVQAMAVLLGLTVLWHGLTIVRFAVHPTYGFVGALGDIQRIVLSDGGQRRLVLGVSAANMSLATGIPSLNDAFGSEDLSEKVSRLQPGWFLAWNGVGDDIHAALPNEDIVPVARYNVFDDPSRSVLVFYRLQPRLSADGLQSPVIALH